MRCLVIELLSEQLENEIVLFECFVFVVKTFDVYIKSLRRGIFLLRYT